MSLGIYGAGVANGVAQEKTSRTAEVLLASLRPGELLAGKVAGIGACGLGQLAVAVGSGLIANGVVHQAEIPATVWVLLPAVLAWFLLGYALYSLACAAAGALVARQEEVQLVTMPFAVALIAGYLLTYAAIASPGSAWVRWLSLLPPVAPVLMPARIALGHVAAWEEPVAVALVLAAIVAVARLAARIYADADAERTQGLPGRRPAPAPVSLPRRERRREWWMAARGWHPVEGLERGWLEVGGRRRSFWLARPDRAGAPLLVVLHGLGTNGRNAAAFSGLAGRGPAAGFATAFPDGWGEAWRYEPPPGPAAVDEVAFVRALVGRLVADGVAGPTPPVLAGVSNGAFFAEHLARHGLLAVSGLALVAGTALETSRTASPRPAQQAAVVCFQGTADPSVPYEGGPLGRPGPFGWLVRRRARRWREPGALPWPPRPSPGTGRPPTASPAPRRPRPSRPSRGGCPSRGLPGPPPAADPSSCTGWRAAATAGRAVLSTCPPA